ncbi:MAG: hypothetical protein PHU21_06435 [Elusimicrobia bacterium]|nr:hypothetical protein [Elusimicrobiota bacterium]
MKTSMYRLTVIMLSLAAVGLAGISATNAASSNSNSNSYGNSNTQQEQPQGGCCG